MLNGLALCGVDKAAGVEDGHVGPLRLPGHLMAGGTAKGHHLFGVDEVFGTPQRYKGNGIGHDIRSRLKSM